MTLDRQSASQMKKGFVRLFILANLYREPLHGYGIIKRISERSDGFWAPKAGNVYPLMSDMAREGLIERQGSNGRRKVYRITEDGKRELLRLFSEAEDAIVHLVRAMNLNEGEWIETHASLLSEIEPGTREERMKSMLSTIDSLIDVLGRTRANIRMKTDDPATAASGEGNHGGDD